MRFGERGFTLIEVIVAFAVLAVVLVGALTVVGAAGFLDTFPTAFGGGRVAKDYTAASVYLQAFHEHLAGVGSENLDLSGGCAQSFTPADGELYGFASPSSPGFQLDWAELQVQFERWEWNGTQYASTGPDSCDAPAEGDDAMMRVVSTLTWRLKGTARPPLSVERFIPRTPGGTSD